MLELTHCTNVRNRDLLIVSDSGLRLRSLTIGDDALKPWVTNKGLASIGRMAWLRALALHDCNSVTNNGLARLLPLTGLTSLSLRGCRKITNNGLDMLKVRALPAHARTRFASRAPRRAARQRPAAAHRAPPPARSPTWAWSA